MPATETLWAEILQAVSEALDRVIEHLAMSSDHLLP